MATKIEIQDLLRFLTLDAKVPLPSAMSKVKDLQTVNLTSATRLSTNRAPLVLAFVVILLKYTMPSQPLSSRLSLAQAVVSVNSRSKAVNIGLVEKGTGAEEEGWGLGQPVVKIMGREIKIMRRHGYDPHEGAAVKAENQEGGNIKEEESLDTESTLKHDNESLDEEPALWGLDLEALRSGNGPLFPTTQQQAGGLGLPVYSAQNARAYIMKSFASLETEETQSSSSKKASASAQRLQKEENLARLLRALDLLYQSWAHILSKDDLDKRAWSWYVAVRPDVKEGVAGWGGKGEVHLQKILDMRRKG
ncbi:uncharacterized protein KY384_000733 [Bacidia gigantensis]|uniref:uncharacterized protein n=1 Tax=Bacidia gigantensis TaxID=2732470 RepID=UPI001D04D6BF|nr:uncharacterized protein KY384_000733 [Bacidia gigantensis]KAG8525971.1 hypothetical protein KY384_000733 [Bacidia gigantensis]